MTDNQEKIDQLLDKLETLLKRQDDFLIEINTLQIEVDRLATTKPRRLTKSDEIKKENITTKSQTYQQQTTKEKLKKHTPKAKKPSKIKIDVETIKIKGIVAKNEGGNFKFKRVLYFENELSINHKEKLLNYANNSPVTRALKGCNEITTIIK